MHKPYKKYIIQNSLAMIRYYANRNNVIIKSKSYGIQFKCFIVHLSVFRKTKKLLNEDLIGNFACFFYMQAVEQNIYTS